MPYLLRGFTKFIVANVTVIIVIMLLPVFLVTNSVPFLDTVMDFLFSNKSIQ